MNKDISEGKWKDFKGELLNTWGKLTSDDLDRTKGNILSIGGLIQEKYGHAKEEVMAKLSELGERFSSIVEDKKAETSGTVVDGLEDTKQDLRDSKN